MGNRLIGLELEYSDIFAKKAEVSLYSYFGYDFSEWQNCYGETRKQKLDYSKWNCVTDHTIHNSDGTRCSLTYIKNNEITPIIKRDDFINYTKGIEVISPATGNYSKLLDDIDAINKIMISNGAAISKELDNALHIHIDANDIDFETVRLVPQKMLKIQDHLVKFLTIGGIEVPLYTEDDVLRLSRCESVQAFIDQYSTRSDGTQYNINHYKTRRIVDIGSWLKNEEPVKTIEFRAFSMSNSIDYIRECLNLCLDIFDYLIFDKELKDLESRTEYIESLYSGYVPGVLNN